MPILRAVLMTRQAISPRLAIRIFLNMRRPRRTGSDPSPRSSVIFDWPARGPTPRTGLLGPPDDREKRAMRKGDGDGKVRGGR